MKIGVMTFWFAQENYGQLLQCYALQKYLRDAGHDAFLIRYHPYFDAGLELPRGFQTNPPKEEMQDAVPQQPQSSAGTEAKAEAEAGMGEHSEQARCPAHKRPLARRLVRALNPYIFVRHFVRLARHSLKKRREAQERMLREAEERQQREKEARRRREEEEQRMREIEGKSSLCAYAEVA